MSNTHPAVVEHYRKMGRKGGRARKLALSPERASMIGRKAARARWRQWRAKRASKNRA